MSRLLAILGRRGWGKTMLAKSLAREAPRLVILDPHWEYQADEVGGAAVCDGLYDVPDVLASERPRVIIRPDDEIEDFDLLMQLAFHMRGTTFVIDEAEQFYTSGNVSRAFRKAIAKSRLAGNDYLLVGHRPVELPTKFRALCDWALFRTTNPRDLEFYDELGVPASDLARLPRLGKGEFVTFSERAA